MAIVAQAVVGAALIASAVAGLLLIRRPMGSLARIGALLLIAVGLLVGLALVSPALAPLLPSDSRNSDVEQFAWWAAAVLAPLAAVATLLLIRRVLELPSTAELEGRVAAHRRTLDRLREARKELEERVAERSQEVYEAKKRLEVALRDTNITVSMTDRDLRYIWIRNAPAGFDAQFMLGRTDEEILHDQGAKDAAYLKRRVLETGEDQRGRIVHEYKGRTRYFDMTAEPYRNGDDDSIAGVLCVSVEETEQVEREERLRSVLREMSHRSKNMLTVLLGIARQTAQRSNSLESFLESFDARLRALVGSQDLLVEHDWRAVPLDALLRTQLKPYLSPSDKRLDIEGPDVRIRAEPAQNLGLAFHELARNAHRFGALSAPKGKIRVNWSLDPAEDPSTLRIVWREVGGPEVIPPTSPPGFGRTMTERILARALDGKASINYRPEGVVCEIDISMSHVEV